MIGTLTTAVIAGLGGVLLQYWRERRAEAEHDRLRTMEAYAKGDAQAQADEKAIKDAAEKARNSASSDFINLN